MALTQLSFLDLLKEKSNTMNSVFQLFQGTLNSAIKELLSTVPNPATNHVSHHETKIQRILSDFSFQMNHIEVQYLQKCQMKLNETSLESQIPNRITQFIDDDEEYSAHGSSDDYIDSEDENTLNHYDDSPRVKCVNTAESQCIPIPNRDLGRSSIMKEDRFTVDFDDRPFHCSECPETFKLKKNWAYHVREVHNGYPYPCNQCDQRFKFKNELRVHQKSICNNQYDHSSSVFQNNREIKPVPETDYVERPRKRRKLSTDSISQSFVSHRDGKTVQSRSGSESQKDSKRKKMTDFQCELCGKYLMDQTGLDMHMKLHNEPRKYRCNRCEAAFHFPFRLTAHLLNVHNVMPFSCDSCNKGFRRKKDLKMHLHHCTGTVTVQSTPYGNKQIDVVRIEGTEVNREEMVNESGLTANKEHVTTASSRSIFNHRL